MRAIFQHRAELLYKNFFSENFCLVCESQVSADMGIKMRTKKNTFFHGEEKTNIGGRKTDTV